jgi:hypothetical protein
MRRIAPFIVLSIALLLLGSCVLPGTGTMNVRNRLSGREITALYIYPQGDPDTQNEISSPMEYDDVHMETGLEPGMWTVKAIVDSGADTATEDVEIEEGVIDIVWILNVD